MKNRTLVALGALGAIAFTAIAIKLSKAKEKETEEEGVKATAIVFEPERIPAEIGPLEAFEFVITATVENYSIEPTIEKVYITVNDNIIHSAEYTFPGYGMRDIEINEPLSVDDEVCVYTRAQGEEEGMPT